MDHYRRAEYEAAFNEALKIKMPGRQWTHVVLATSYAGLGEEAEAAASIDGLIGVYPDFAAKARPAP